MQRRDFLTAAAAAPVAAAAVLSASTRPMSAQQRPPAAIRPARLKAGATVGLVAPANATFNSYELDIARDSLAALGLEVRVGEHLRDRHGYLAGQDRDRAADINGFFNDSSVSAVLPIRGGWGSARLLPYLDYDIIRRNPKVVVGYSDVTALLTAIHARTGLVTFHGANGMGRWDQYSLDFFRRVLFEGEAVTFTNTPMFSETNVLTPVRYRTQTIRPGTARGRLLGGNLSVLAGIVGSPYVPDWDDAILFLEDVGEAIYRVDRMLTTLKLAGILGRIRGFIFGTCSECDPGSGFGALTFEELWADHIAPLDIPAWSGAMIGHGMPQWTLPVGAEVAIDASAGTIRLLEPAVR
ncbi:MAG TPA: LD-carboxypeptidase [Vicinamibacterales bacterium]|nr:LD-carboxypeptidase [Vicinamibacterales bacterium]